MAHQRGFSVIEALVAMTVLAIAILGMIGLIPQSFSMSEHQAERLQAVAVGQQYLDGFRQSIVAAGDNSKVSAPAPVAVDQGDAIVARAGSVSANASTLTLSAAKPGANGYCPPTTTPGLYHCSVTVQWTTGQGTFRAVVDTDVYP